MGETGFTAGTAGITVRPCADLSPMRAGRTNGFNGAAGILPSGLPSGTPRARWKEEATVDV